MSAVKGNHLKRIRELKSMRQMEITVTTSTTTSTLELPAGVRVSVPELRAEWMLYSPAAAATTLQVQKSTQEASATASVPTAPVEGVFLRQWGSRGAGPGQFNCPSAVAVNGSEVLVCDGGNHRVQVFR